MVSLKILYLVLLYSFNLIWYGFRYVGTFLLLVLFIGTILRTEEIGSVCDSDVSNTVSLLTDIEVVETGVLESFLTIYCTWNS